MWFIDLLSWSANNIKLPDRPADMSSDELTRRVAMPNLNIYKKLAQVEPPIINFSKYTSKIEETESEHLVMEAL